MFPAIVVFLYGRKMLVWMHAGFDLQSDSLAHEPEQLSRLQYTITNVGGTPEYLQTRLCCSWFRTPISERFHISFTHNAYPKEALLKPYFLFLHLNIHVAHWEVAARLVDVHESVSHAHIGNVWVHTHVGRRPLKPQPFACVDGTRRLEQPRKGRIDR